MVDAMSPFSFLWPNDPILLKPHIVALEALVGALGADSFGGECF
jgi:hypothetical protein